MKYKLTEKDYFQVSEYNYHEEFDNYEDAFNRMRQMYHDVVIEGNSDAIEKSEFNKMSAYVLINDGNEIEWDIEEIQ